MNTIDILKKVFTFPYRCILYVRSFKYRLLAKKIGKNFIIASGSVIWAPENIEIGDNVYVNVNVSLNAQWWLVIGNNVLIWPNSSIWTSNHNFEDPNIPINKQGDVFSNVFIGNDVWIGAGSIVLPWVHIGTGSIIGAGSIVTKNIPEYVVAVWNPAKVIRSRK